MRSLLPIAALILLLGCLGSQPREAARPELPSPEQVQVSPPEPLPEMVVQPEAPVENTTFEEPVSEPPPEPAYDFNQSHNDSGALIIDIFHSKGCSACKAIMPEIDYWMSVCQGVDWRIYDIATHDGTEAYLDFAEGKNLSLDKRYVPQALVNGSIITNRFRINETLPQVLLASGGCAEGSLDAYLPKESYAFG